MNFLPELAMLLTAGALFAVAVIWPKDTQKSHQVALWLGLGTLMLACADFGTWYFGAYPEAPVETTIFFGAYRVDVFSQLIKVGIALAFFLVVAISERRPGIVKHAQNEFFLLLAVSAAGMMMLASSVELITIYVSMELASYSLYILVALRRYGSIEREAGLKYLLIGAVASALTLYGMSLLFGMTDSTYLVDTWTVNGLKPGIVNVIQADPNLLNQPAMLVGVILVLSGFFFKLGVFPFHFWAPDVYTGADNQVVAFIGSASKLAAVALLCRLLGLAMQGDQGFQDLIVPVLIVFSIASMTLGNLLAIVQKDFKRLLAYSAIAHAGYIVLGLLSMSTLGLTSAIFYGLVYLLMSFACFFVIVQLSPKGENPQISDLAGLYRRAPLLGLLLLVALFGLAGVPPTAGFVGKWFLFAAAVESEHYWVVLVGAVNAVVSVYYYLVVVKEAYLKPGDDLPTVKMTTPMASLATVLIVVIVVLGVYPTVVWDFATHAANAVGQMGLTGP